MKLKREGTPKQDINMKKLFRRNQIIITTLAIMIAAAGYLNYAGKRDLAASTGEDIYQAGTFDISEEDLLALRDLERSLPTLKRVEVLPYHTLGLFKWKKLGITYSLNGVPTPTEEEVRRAEEILEVHKYQ